MGSRFNRNVMNAGLVLAIGIGVVALLTGFPILFAAFLFVCQTWWGIHTVHGPRRNIAALTVAAVGPVAVFGGAMAISITYAAHAEFTSLVWTVYCALVVGEAVVTVVTTQMESGNA